MDVRIHESVRMHFECMTMIVCMYVNLKVLSKLI